MPEEVKTEFNPDILQDMLPIYYKRLFPHKQFYRWLSYKLCELPRISNKKERGEKQTPFFPPKPCNAEICTTQLSFIDIFS